MEQKRNIWVKIWIAVLGLGALTLLILVFSYAFKIDRVPNEISITLLEAYIVVFTLFIALLAILGYQGLKDIAETQARKSIEGYIEDMEERIKESIKESLVPIVMQEASNKLMKEVPNKLINRMLEENIIVEKEDNGEKNV